MWTVNRGRKRKKLQQKPKIPRGREKASCTDDYCYTQFWNSLIDAAHCAMIHNRSSRRVRVRWMASRCTKILRPVGIYNSNELWAKRQEGNTWSLPAKYKVATSDVDKTAKPLLRVREDDFQMSKMRSATDSTMEAGETWRSSENYSVMTAVVCTSRCHAGRGNRRTEILSMVGSTTCKICHITARQNANVRPNQAQAFR